MLSRANKLNEEKKISVSCRAKLAERSWASWNRQISWQTSGFVINQIKKPVVCHLVLQRQSINYYSKRVEELHGNLLLVSLSVRFDLTFYASFSVSSLTVNKKRGNKTSLHSWFICFMLLLLLFDCVVFSIQRGSMRGEKGWRTLALLPVHERQKKIIPT